MFDPYKAIAEGLNALLPRIKGWKEDKNQTYSKAFREMGLGDSLDMAEMRRTVRELDTLDLWNIPMNLLTNEACLLVKILGRLPYDEKVSGIKGDDWRQVLNFLNVSSETRTAIGELLDLETAQIQHHMKKTNADRVLKRHYREALDILRSLSFLYDEHLQAIPKKIWEQLATPSQSLVQICHVYGQLDALYTSEPSPEVNGVVQDLRRIDPSFSSLSLEQIAQVLKQHSALWMSAEAMQPLLLIAIEWERSPLQEGIIQHVYQARQVLQDAKVHALLRAVFELPELVQKEIQYMHPPLIKEEETWKTISGILAWKRLTKEVVMAMCMPRTE